MLNNDYFYLNPNETEIKNNDENSSLFKWMFDLVNGSIGNEATPKLEKEAIPKIEKLTIELQAQIKKYIYDERINHLTKEVVNLLKYFSLDDSDVSQAEKKIWDIEEKYGSRVLGEILQNIYIQYNDFPKMLMGICRAINRFELHEVMPWGPTMLVGLLSHKNENVKEYAVSVVENWADIELLPVLRNLDCSSLWLKEYIQDVVNYLEECYALRKKII